jgi:hypothetical protein
MLTETQHFAKASNTLIVMIDQNISNPRNFLSSISHNVGEMELLLQPYTFVPIPCSILWLYPHSHPRHTSIVCDFDDNVSNLWF